MAGADIHDAPIYDKLVLDVDDVEGLVAYALYKASERAWMKGFAERHDGEHPTEAEIVEFVASHDPASIQRLANEAQSMLISFGYVMVEEERPQIGAQAVALAIGTHFESHGVDDANRHTQVMGRLAEGLGLRRELMKAIVAAFVVNVVTLVLIFLFLAPNPVDTFIYLFRHSAAVERIAPTLPEPLQQK